MTRSKKPLPTARQWKIYIYIVEFKQNHDGNSPAISQIMQAVEINSPSVVRYHLDALERLQLIKRSGNPRDARMISVVGATWTAPAEL